MIIFHNRKDLCNFFRKKLYRCLLKCPHLAGFCKRSLGQTGSCFMLPCVGSLILAIVRPFSSLVALNIGENRVGWDDKWKQNRWSGEKLVEWTGIGSRRIPTQGGRMLRFVAISRCAAAAASCIALSYGEPKSVWTFEMFVPVTCRKASRFLLFDCTNCWDKPRDPSRLQPRPSLSRRNQRKVNHRIPSTSNVESTISLVLPWF